MRKKSINLRRLIPLVKFLRKLYPERDYWKPKTRGDCKSIDRPCPYVSCKYHLYLDVNPKTGSITFNFPDLEVWDLEETCALDVADRDGCLLSEVGKYINLTRERIRQYEVEALGPLKCALENIRIDQALIDEWFESRAANTDEDPEDLAA